MLADSQQLAEQNMMVIVRIGVIKRKVNIGTL